MILLAPVKNTVPTPDLEGPTEDFSLCSAPWLFSSNWNTEIFSTKNDHIMTGKSCYNVRRAKPSSWVLSDIPLLSFQKECSLLPLKAFRSDWSEFTGPQMTFISILNPPCLTHFSSLLLSYLLSDLLLLIYPDSRSLSPMRLCLQVPWVDIGTLNGNESYINQSSFHPHVFWFLFFITLLKAWIQVAIQQIPGKHAEKCTSK